MSDPLAIGVKDAITKYPQLEELLTHYNIGCGPCPVGTCLLKDVVSIHGLSADEQAVFLEKANEIIKGENVVIDNQGGNRSEQKDQGYSASIKRLVHEHVYIKYVVHAILGIVKSFDVENKNHRLLIDDVIDFIRNYADRYHHAKEEDILFKYFDESQEIIQVMYKDHHNGRGFVKNILKALDAHDNKVVCDNLLDYHDLLLDHIRREDDILYVWMDKELTAEQLLDMDQKFKEVEAEFGELPRKHEAFALSMSKKYSSY